MAAPFDEALRRTSLPARVGDAVVRLDEQLVLVERSLQPWASWQPLAAFATSVTVACLSAALVLFTEATGASLVGLLLTAGSLVWHHRTQRRPRRQVCVFNLERRTLRVDTISAVGRQTSGETFSNLQAVALEGARLVCRSSGAEWVVAEAVAPDETEAAERVVRVLTSVVGLEHRAPPAEPAPASRFVD